MIIVHFESRSRNQNIVGMTKDQQIYLEGPFVSFDHYKPSDQRNVGFYRSSAFLCHRCFYGKHLSALVWPCLPFASVPKGMTY